MPRCPASLVAHGTTAKDRFGRSNPVATRTGSRSPSRVTMSRRHLRRRGGGRRHDRLRPEPARRVGEPEVVRPEVVPPLGHAVRLVDHEQADVGAAQALEEAGRGEALRRDVEQPQVAGGRLLDRPRGSSAASCCALTSPTRPGATRSSASTWSCISDTSGETTSVRSVRISAAAGSRATCPRRSASPRARRDPPARRRPPRAWPGRKRGEAEQLVQRAVRVGGARDRPRQRRPEAGQGEGRGSFHGPRTLPPGPAGSGSVRKFDADRGRLPRRAHPSYAARSSARSCSRCRRRLVRARRLEHGRSDVDVTASSRARSTPREAAARRPRSATRRCRAPRSGLELVLYPRAHAARPPPRARLRSTSTPARASTSAPTSRPATSRASGSPSTARSCASTGSSLHGPPPAELLAPIPRALIAPVLEESIRWHRGDATRPTPSSTSPAAATSSTTGHWISKLEAQQRLDDEEGAP